MSTANWEERVLQHVSHPHYRPVKPRVIARALGAEGDEVGEVRRLIKRMVRSGQLVYGDKHRIFPLNPAAAAPLTSEAGQPPRRRRLLAATAEGESAGGPLLVVGTFRRAAAGFGFVRLLNAGPLDEDIYVAERATSDAANGDRVQLRMGKPVRRGPRIRKSGEIVRVLERAHKQFVGTYSELLGRGLVQIDGTAFARPIDVGDPGAKGVRPGDKVVVEMVRYPRGGEDHGEAVITVVLGERGEPGFDFKLIASQFDLPGDFPEEVLADAREQAEQFDGAIPEQRADLTGTCTITIDPVDARDFDDAVSVERYDNGHWRLGVHIADVVHFVPFGTALDREARERATSIYLPDRVIPMLPEIISNHLASLQPDRVRYTKTAWIEYTAEGVPVSTELRLTAIRSQRRFSYEEVDEYLADPAAWREKLTPAVHELLGRMAELARILRGRRLQRGALELDLPEVKVELNDRQEMKGCRKVEQTESHKIIEEFMLAANEAVAVRLRDWGIHFLRRVHASPDPRKLIALTHFVRDLGIETESLESRFALREVLGKVRGCGEEYAVNYAVLRSMPKAEYAPHDEGHFALASDCYCHFTSPIRRYPDLTIHRTLDAVFRGKRPVIQFDQLVELGRHCSEREQRAEMAERELIKLKLLGYLSHRIGHRMEGVITGVEDYGLFVQGLEIPAEGLVPIQTMTEDHYYYDSRAHLLMGRQAQNQYRLGDVVRVVVKHVDLDRRQLEFQLVGRVERGTLRHAATQAKSGRKRSAQPQRKRRNAARGELGGGRRKKRRGDRGR